MRKLLLALPLVAGASWAGTTYYAGSQTQPAYEKLISQLNQLKPFTVESEQYHAGFMSSTAITKVMDSTGPNASVLFRLKHIIDHSPIGVDNDGTRIGASSIVTTLMTDDVVDPDALNALSKFDDNKPFELHTRVGLAGEAVNELFLSKFSMSENGRSVSFDGGHFEVVSDKSGAVTGNGSFGKVQVNSENSTALEIASSPASFDLKHVADGLYSGDYSFSIPTVSYSNVSDGTEVILRGLSISSETKLTGENLFSDVNVKVDSIQSPMPVDAVSWKTSIDNFSLTGLAEYQRLMQTLPMVDGSNADPTEMMSTMSDAYKALLTPGIAMSTNLVLTNSGGVIGSSVNLTFVGDGTTDGSGSISTLRDLLMAVSASVVLDADAEALNQTPAAMMLMHPMAGQYVLSDGVSYKSNIKVADLLLDVNGDTQSLEALIGPMLEMPLDMAMMSQ